MEKQQIFEELQVIISNSDVVSEEIKLESNFKDDLGLDSLDFVETIMRIELKYDILITDHNAEELKTVENAVDYLYKVLNQ